MWDTTIYINLLIKIMKKLTTSAIFYALLLYTAAQANVLTSTKPVITIVQEKVAVKPEDLPEAVKTTLASDAYAGWQVVSAFLITKEDNSQFFEISLKKGEETSKLNLDKDGKKVE